MEHVADYMVEPIEISPTCFCEDCLVDYFSDHKSIAGGDVL